MKSYFIVFLITAPAFCQTQTSEEALYWEAYNTRYLHYDNGMWYKRFSDNDHERLAAKRGIDSLQHASYGIYTRFIELYPDSEFIAAALYEKGIIEFRTDKLVELKVALKKF